MHIILKIKHYIRNDLGDDKFLHCEKLHIAFYIKTYITLYYYYYVSRMGGEELSSSSIYFDAMLDKIIQKAVI